MAGSLVKIAETTVSSAVASVTLTGIDSTYDVYMVKYNNVTPDTDVVVLRGRVTESSTPNSTANYDYAAKLLRSTTSFYNSSSTNQTSWLINHDTTGTGTGEQTNGINYIFNANNSGEYTFITVEDSFLEHNGNLEGSAGGSVFTSASTVNGVQYFFSSGNIASGTFTLYGLKK